MLLNKYTVDENEPRHEFTVFLLQRLAELLSLNTFESWRPFTMAPNNLLQEAVEAIELLEKDPKKQSQVKYILEEISYTFKKNRIIAKMLPSSIDRYYKEDDRKILNATEIGKIISAIRAKLTPKYYYAELVNYVRKSIVTCRKSEADEALTLLISFYIGIGYSREYLVSRFKVLTSKMTRTPINRNSILDEFCNFSITPKAFSAYVIVGAEIERMQKIQKPEILNAWPLRWKKHNRFTSQCAGKGRVVVKFTGIESLDQYGAYHEAMRRITGLKNLASLYSHSNLFSVDKSALIVSNSDKI